MYGRTKVKEEAVAASENAKKAQAADSLTRDSLESFDDAGVLNEAVKVAGIYPAIDSDDAEDDKKILEDHGIEVPVQLPKPKPEVVTEKEPLVYIFAERERCFIQALRGQSA